MRPAISRAPSRLASSNSLGLISLSSPLCTSVFDPPRHGNQPFSPVSNVSDNNNSSFTYAHDYHASEKPTPSVRQEHCPPRGLSCVNSYGDPSRSGAGTGLGSYHLSFADKRPALCPDTGGQCTLTDSLEGLTQAIDYSATPSGHPLVKLPSCGRTSSQCNEGDHTSTASTAEDLSLIHI